MGRMEKKKLQSKRQDKFETTTDIAQTTPFQLKIILGRLLLTEYVRLAAGVGIPWPLLREKYYWSFIIFCALKYNTID